MHRGTGARACDLRYARAHTMSEPPPWVSELREAVRGKMSPGIEVARGEAPSWLEAGGLHALTSAFLAAFVAAASVLRARVAPLHFDLPSVLLRTAALAFALRAAIAIARFARVVARGRKARAHTLAWSREGILEQCEGRERVLARARLLAVAISEATESRTAFPAQRFVYLVARPEREISFLRLPAYLARSPEILHARLTRLLDPRAETVAHPPPGSAEERYERAARGTLEPGEVVVPEGRGYRLRAPYTALLGVPFALEALRSAGPLRAQLAPTLIAACLLSVGFVAGWFAWIGKRRAARRGIAMLLTPEELIARGPAFVVSVPWGQLAGVHVHTKLSWSPFVGSYPVRQLRIEARDGSLLTFDAGFLGVPVEVAAALIRAHPVPPSAGVSEN